MTFESFIMRKDESQKGQGDMVKLSQQLSSPRREEEYGWVDGQSEKKECMVTLMGYPCRPK